MRKTMMVTPELWKEIALEKIKRGFSCADNVISMWKESHEKQDEYLMKVRAAINKCITQGGSLEEALGQIDFILMQKDCGK